MDALPPGFDVGGWQEIASTVGLSVSTVQRLRKTADPPPVYQDIGRVIAVRRELIEWRLRQVRKL